MGNGRGPCPGFKYHEGEEPSRPAAECTQAEAGKGMQGQLAAASTQGAAHETTGNPGRSAQSHSPREMPKKKKKKRPRVCKLDIPSKKPHHSIPVGHMMFAKEKVQPQPCKRNKILHDLKADNILAFQMSLLIFPPFRTAKSLHGCF